MQAPPNAVQDFAYQALENLAFDQLDGTVNSLPMGRLGLLLHIKGRNEPVVQVAETRVGGGLPCGAGVDPWGRRAGTALLWRKIALWTKPKPCPLC